MNVQVTGVPMRTRWMSTSADPRVGQLATRPCRRGMWEYKHTKAPRLHGDLTTRDTRPNHTTTVLALWSSLTLETRSHPWVLAGHPQYTGAWFARKAVEVKHYLLPNIRRASYSTLRQVRRRMGNNGSRSCVVMLGLWLCWDRTNRCWWTW